MDANPTPHSSSPTTPNANANGAAGVGSPPPPSSPPHSPQSQGASPSQPSHKPTQVPAGASSTAAGPVTSHTAASPARSTSPTPSVGAGSGTSIWSTVSSSARAILYSVENGIRGFLSATDLRPFPTEMDDDDRVFMLGGIKYLPADSKGHAEFISDFSSRPRLTYRCDFVPIAPTSLTTDSGWGCMVRVGQSMLFETLARIQLGRGHRLPPDALVGGAILAEAETTVAPGSELLELLKMFKDDPSAPYSIHSMTVMGQELDTPIGHWFGPTVLAHTIKRLCQSTPNAPLVFVAQDATIYPQDVRDMWDGTSLSTRPLLLLVPLLLGIENMTPIYWPFIQECIKCPYSVGIAGGRPSSALYMVGTFRDALLVLDPHYTQPALRATPDDWYTCFTPTVRCLASTSLDPSMCLGFMLQDRSEWDRWMAWMDGIKADGVQVPICIAPATASGIMYPAGGVDGGGKVDAWDESSETDGDDG